MTHLCSGNGNNDHQGCDLTKVKNPEKWGSGPGAPFDLKDKAPEPPRCLILKDLQTLHIPS